MEHRLIIVCAGSIGIGLFLSYWPDEQGLLVFIEVKRAQQFGDGTASWVFFMRNTEVQVRSECKPGNAMAASSSLSITAHGSTGYAMQGPNGQAQDLGERPPTRVGCPGEPKKDSITTTGHLQARQCSYHNSRCLPHGWTALSC